MAAHDSQTDDRNPLAQEAFGAWSQGAIQRRPPTLEPESDAAEELFPLPISVFASLQDLEQELLDLIRSYSPCVDAIEACGRIMRDALGNWSSESRERRDPPGVSYWNALKNDVRSVKHDDLKRAIAPLRPFGDDTDPPALIVHDVERLLEDARRDLQTSRARDATDCGLAERVENSIAEVETQLAQLARAIRARAELLGLEIQRGVIKIFEEIENQRAQRRNAVNEQRQQGRSVRPAATMGDTTRRPDHGR